MGTFLFSEDVFGPVNSRRLGVSLGINLLSTKQKVCNFDCVYCECGFTPNAGSISDKFADADRLISTLEKRLSTHQDPRLDAITFAGNGEPTLHPRFEEISSKIRKLRDYYYPNCKIVLLTNGTTLHKTQVRKALENIDIVAIKLDAGTDQLIEEVDRPLSPLSTEKLIHRIKRLNRPVKIQTMFLRGMINGNAFDNSREEHLLPWLKCIKEIRPQEVMLYSLDRETPLNSLEPVSRNTLEHIAELLKKEGIASSIA